MNKESRKELKINKILIIMGVVCSILAIAIIILPSLNKSKIETFANSSKQMKNNYTTTTESNTWDISKNGDGSVIATLDGNGLLTITGSGEMKGWSGNGEVPWYSVRNQIKNVKIENGVTNIGCCAFEDCKSLISIEIPESITRIEDRAFWGCRSVTSIEIPKSVTSIGDGAFLNCASLTSIEIPESITRIEDRAFYGCISVTSIEIPKSVTIIGFRAFEACTGLTSIEIPSSVTSIGGYAFNGCKNLTSIQIPESVTSVGYGAFKDCTSLTSIEFSSSVTKLDDRVLANCTSLRNIKVPESVKYISPSAFYYCISLTNIEVDANNEKYCDENGVLYTKDKKEIIKYPAGKMETTITIIDGLTSIGGMAFQECRSLTRIEIPTTVTSIGSNAFNSCTSLTNIEVDVNNEKYCDENGVLYTKDKKGIIRYPEGKVETTYTIINGVTSIGDSAFEDCTSLTSIEIPKSVTSIGRYAFEDCTSLTSIEIPEGVTSIGDSVFFNCERLTSIKIPEGVTSLENLAFYNCKSLTSIVISKSITSISNNVFTNCSNLTIICKSGSTAETYAKENSKKYQTDDIGPKIESTPATNTNPSKKIEVKINVADEVAGLNEQSIKYLWSEESQNITKDQITEQLINGETLQLKDVTGTYYLWIYAKDNVGNETIEKKGPFKLDNTAPTVNINYSTTTATNQNVKVTIKANEELQGITGWTKSANGQELTKEYTSNTVEEGENITIKDLAGNESTVNVKVLNIDKERPTVNLNYSTTTITNQSVTVTITGNEELQGITGWTKSTNGKQLTKEYTSNTVVAGENITVKDLAGNESKVNVKVLNIDKELPTLEISTEITSTTISVTTVAKDSNSGINEQSYKYYIKEENGTYGEGIADGNTHIFIDLKLEQKYDIKVEVTDNAGNKTSKEVQVTTKKSNKVTSTEYKIFEEKLMIKEIQPKTTAGEIKNKIQGEMEFKIINAKGETVSDTAKVATVYKIKLEDNKEYTLVVTGDSNGDGETNIKDILAINKHRLNKANLVGAFLEAGDVNGDGIVDIKDILQINKFRLGKITEI